MSTWTQHGSAWCFGVEQWDQLFQRSINQSFFDSTLAVWEVGFNRHLVLTKIECVLRILFVFRSLKSFQQVF